LIKLCLCWLQAWWTNTWQAVVSLLINHISPSWQPLRNVLWIIVASEINVTRHVDYVFSVTVHMDCCRSSIETDITQWVTHYSTASALLELPFCWRMDRRHFVCVTSQFPTMSTYFPSTVGCIIGRVGCPLYAEALGTLSCKPEILRNRVRKCGENHRMWGEMER
jgi:hypothetical protein